MDAKTTVWVTGSKGYLGRAIVRRLAVCVEKYRVMDTDIDVDITDLEAVRTFVERNRPEVIINCAGIRRENADEVGKAKTYKVNAIGARNLAIASADTGAIMVQCSSDDVFPANGDVAKDEFDAPHPDTIYGKSKRAGEAFVREFNPRHVILRSSWLYHGDGGRMGAIIEAAKSGKKIAQRTDQYAAPTSVSTYVDYLLKLISEPEFGIFHITCEGKASRYEFAAKCLELMGYNPADVLEEEVDPATAENVALDNMMIKLIDLDDMPTWEEDLAHYLKEVNMLKGGE